MKWKGREGEREHENRPGDNAQRAQFAGSSGELARFARKTLKKRNHNKRVSRALERARCRTEEIRTKKGDKEIKRKEMK